MKGDMGVRRWLPHIWWERRRLHMVMHSKAKSMWNTKHGNIAELKEVQSWQSGLYFFWDTGNISGKKLCVLLQSAFALRKPQVVTICRSQCVHCPSFQLQPLSDGPLLKCFIWFLKCILCLCDCCVHEWPSLRIQSASPYFWAEFVISTCFPFGLGATG